ncbi:hypothetical protein C0J52_24509, partial [Blattella germanica]
EQAIYINCYALYEEKRIFSLRQLENILAETLHTFIPTAIILNRRKQRRSGNEDRKRRQWSKNYDGLECSGRIGSEDEMKAKQREQKSQ